MSSKVLFALLLCVAAASANISRDERRPEDLRAVDPSDIEQLERIREDLETATRAIQEELETSRRTSERPEDREARDYERKSTTKKPEQRDERVRDRKCDVFSCISKLTTINASERIDTESILASINAGKLDAPSKIVLASCRKFNDFNKCLGGDWLDCFDKKTVVDVINQIFKAMPIPAIHDMSITPAQLEDLSQFVIEFCSRVEDVPAIDFRQCQLDSIAVNEKLAADFKYLAQFDFDSCPSVSCDFAKRLVNLLTHSSRVACGDDVATLSFALSRAAVKSFLRPESVLRSSSPLSSSRRDTCDITEDEFAVMKNEPIQSIEEYLNSSIKLACGENATMPQNSGQWKLLDDHLLEAAMAMFSLGRNGGGGIPVSQIPDLSPIIAAAMQAASSATADPSSGRPVLFGNHQRIQQHRQKQRQLDSANAKKNDNELDQQNQPTRKQPVIVESPLLLVDAEPEYLDYDDSGANRPNFANIIFYCSLSLCLALLFNSNQF